MLFEGLERRLLKSTSKCGSQHLCRGAYDCPQQISKESQSLHGHLHLHTHTHTIHMLQLILKISCCLKPGEVAPQLRLLTIFTEELGSIFSTHMASHSLLQLQIQKS